MTDPFGLDHRRCAADGPSVFRKVLIANRGEIAVRVCRTLREMGIVSVAVYSDADADAAHVRAADEAYRLGPAPSSESYLLVDKIVEVCKQANVDAVHPGYGFLSENASFAAALAAADIVFIGPNAEAIESMGSKTAARARMIAADVPVVPGANVDDVGELEVIAEKIGYPIMLKAAAGGGGKGMRLVTEPSSLRDSYERAQSEARKSFGDDTVYMEKAIVDPRHIEIQVLGDSHGNVVHLFERDCSVQRRHQKVIEEAPSPFEGATRERINAMGEVAVKAAKAVNYEGAGTVEFLMDANGDFYFLEMNTRLQVEHPITEMITGFDLVRQQLRVAAGEKLTHAQYAITARGHAIECRIYAEDVPAGFLPAPGRIDVLKTPAGPGVRDDSCAYSGAEISSHYDPLVSKLCVWAATREQAIERMQRALSEYQVVGLTTNLDFHRRVMSEKDFRRGHYTTGYIASHSELTELPKVPTEQAKLLASVLAVARATEVPAPTAVGGAREAGFSTWRANALPR